MSSKRRLRKKSCGDKKRFTAKLAAIHAKTSLKYAKDEVGLSVYRCKFGEHYHVGHRGRR